MHLKQHTVIFNRCLDRLPDDGDLGADSGLPEQLGDVFRVEMDTAMADPPADAERTVGPVYENRSDGESEGMRSEWVFRSRGDDWGELDFCFWIETGTCQARLTIFSMIL
jgi:hypothetical protein